MSTSNTTALDPTLWEIKELFIESALRSRPNEMMATDLTAIDISQIALFNPDQLATVKDGAPLYIGPDLHTALEDDILDCYREPYLQKVLGPKFFDLMKKKGWYHQWESLLQKDFAQAGISPMTKKGNLPELMLKIRALALQRRQGNLAPTIRGSLARRNNEFMVLVITLRNGHPQNREAHKLYFDYSTQYHHFLEALQTTTQNSVIPPVDVAALNRAIDDDSSVSLPNALGISSSTPPASFNSPSISDTRSLRPHDISGYVLEDGPWLYRVVIDRKVVSGQTVNGVAVKDREIKDKSTYSAMLEVIKTAKAGMAADERLTVLIKHSMDEDVCQKWKHYLDGEAVKERQFQAELEASGVWDREVEPFEPWTLRESDRSAALEKRLSAQAYTTFVAEKIHKAVDGRSKERAKFIDGRYDPDFEQYVANNYAEDDKHTLQAGEESMVRRLVTEDDFRRDLENLWP